MLEVYFRFQCNSYGYSHVCHCEVQPTEENPTIRSLYEFWVRFNTWFLSCSIQMLSNLSSLCSHIWVPWIFCFWCYIWHRCGLCWQCTCHTGGHSTQSPAGCCLQLHKLGLFGCAKYRVIYSRIPLCSSQSSWCILAILLGSYYSKRREHLAKVPIWFVPHFFAAVLMWKALAFLPAIIIGTEDSILLLCYPWIGLTLIKFL
jgi:hypothetical protein